MAKYLVVRTKTANNDSLDYDTHSVFEATISEDSLICEMTLAEARRLEQDSLYRCLEIVGPQAVRDEMAEAVTRARKAAAAEAAYKKRQAEATAKRKATMKQRAIEKAKALLEAEGKA